MTDHQKSDPDNGGVVDMRTREPASPAAILRMHEARAEAARVEAARIASGQARAEELLRQFQDEADHQARAKSAPRRVTAKARKARAEAIRALFHEEEMLSGKACLEAIRALDEGALKVHASKVPMNTSEARAEALRRKFNLK